MRLYGIETDAECWSNIDELLELTRLAKATPNTKTIGALKKRLRGYYDLGNTNRGSDRMSVVERTLFWPSVSEAYVQAPNLSSRKTWTEGLNEVDYKLKKYR
jgi:hypothetical protein